MEYIINDEFIKDLIEEPKTVSLEFEDFFKNWKNKKGHYEFDYTIERNDGSSFIIKLRQSRLNDFDFSAILAYSPQEINKVFRLVRYNGRSHTHKNSLDEGKAFYDFHIHKATEKYQLAGKKEEHYAEITNRYSNLRGALDCLIKDCNVFLLKNSQMRLSFDE